MGWGDYTGGGYNWWDTDFSTDPADTDITDVDFSTYDSIDADPAAVDQQIEDWFEDPDFIASLTQLMEEQDFSPDEQSLGEWTNDDWDSYWEDFLDPNYKWWETDFSTYPTDEEETEEEKTDETKKDEDGVYGTGESKDSNGKPLPDPGDHDEGIRIQRGGVIYVIKDGIWHEAKEGDDDEEEDGAGDKGGLFGLGIGPWLKDLFGLSDTGVGDFLSGIFGSSGGIKSLMELMAAYAKIKGSYDQYRYKIPITQSDAMSEYEKAHPLDIDVGLEGLGPNYLEDQLYGIPVGAENVPVPTHKLGFPYAEEIEEEVQVGQRGGIMNARSHGDIVPALLEPGEFVMNLQSVKGAGNGDARQGAKNMYKMMRQLEGMGQ